MQYNQGVLCLRSAPKLTLSEITLFEMFLKPSLYLSPNAIERAYIYIDKCHMMTTRLENARLNSNSLEKMLCSNVPESKHFHSMQERLITARALCVCAHNAFLISSYFH